MAEVYLALGSNLGDRRGQLRRALAALAEAGVRVSASSSLYETPPMYDTDQPKFLNAVVRAETELSPEDLLTALKDIELALGRQPRSRNGPREIDLDILLYGDEQRATDELTIPHPRMHQRAFVRRPLLDVAPDAVIPGRGAARRWLRGLQGQRLARTHARFRA